MLLVTVELFPGCSLPKGGTGWRECGATNLLSHPEEQDLSDAVTKLSRVLESVSFQGAQVLLEAVKSLSLPPQHPELGCFFFPLLRSAQAHALPAGCLCPMFVLMVPTLTLNPAAAEPWAGSCLTGPCQKLWDAL